MLIREVQTSIGAEKLAGLFGPLRRGFVLDSALPANGLGRFCFAGFDPFLVLRARGWQCELLWHDGRTELRETEPLGLLQELLELYRVARPESLPAEVCPFFGGAVGFVGYEFGARLERVSAPAGSKEDLLPDLEFGFYDAVTVLDTAGGMLRICALDTGGRRQETLCEVHEAVLRQAPVKERAEAAARAEPGAAPVSDFTREGYLAAVQAVREYIASGDVYQVNLSQRFEGPFAGDPLALYRRLRKRSPAPYAAYLNLGYATIASSSPERFVELRGGEVATRPIKGTRPRGRTPEEDRALRAELEASEKDRAELLMIVDLERNDLGRVCEVGSVRVEELWTVEGHPTVWHLVAQIRGRLAAGRGATELLRHSLPGGSITGAPKVRAMQIIAELEPVRRGVYTGVIGYIGFDGDAEFNIAIRTLVCGAGRVSYHVGGGVTWDSDPAAEYEETLVKGRAMAAALASL